MLENENMVSVESIAAYFETSTVQLNRVLKKYNTSGLILLKDIKKDIIKEGVLKGMDLDMIATRVGYSVKYIKKNFPESLG